MDDPNARPAWLMHPVVWASGLAGALVSMAHARELNLRQRLTTLAVGVLTAGFVTPVVADWLALGVNAVAAVGFLIGIVSMMLTAIVVQAATAAKDNPAAAIRWVLIVMGRAVPPVAPTTPQPLNPNQPPTSPGDTK